MITVYCTLLDCPYIDKSVNSNYFIFNSVQTLILARRLEQDCCGQAFHHTEHEQVEIKTVLITETVLILKITCTTLAIKTFRQMYNVLFNFVNL